MMDDDPLSTFARRHGLTPEALGELRTLAPVTTVGNESVTEVPVESDGLVDDEPLMGPRYPEPTEGPIDLANDRYELMELLGRGGQGAVYRARDHKMGRMVAMKVLRDRAPQAARARFRTETAVTVDLQHPGIVPVYDRGITADGRPWYTMQILEGHDFRRFIADPEQPLRRLLDLFTRACEAVGFAHERGVVHRDLKPDNIMLGAFGEVRVLDWGLARLDRPEVDEDDTDTPVSLFATRDGSVMGTPRYMAPEQLLGQLDRVGPPSDVYALGLILAEVLTGQPPAGRSLTEIQALRANRSLDPPTAGPEPLRELCRRMTLRDPDARMPHAGAVADAMRIWLEGAERRAQSEALVADATAIEPTIAALRTEADALDTQAGEILDALPAHAPIDEKRPGWQLADRAVEKRRAARLAEVRLRQTLQSALRLDPDSTAARSLLTDHYRARLLEAEAAHDADRAAEFVALLEGHDRAGNVEWLRGDGKVTLFTDPPGATVELRRYEERDRRLVDVHVRSLGITPVTEVPLAMGSYLLIVTAPGRHTVRYPVNIERNGIWDGIAPGESTPHAIPLPALGEIGDDECYVPAGWCTLGGDPDAPDGLPRRRVWIDGFAIGRDPVTHGHYIEWLDALVSAEHEAMRHVPLENPGGAPKAVYRLEAGGHFTLSAAFGTRPRLDWPVVGITSGSMLAFLDWRSTRANVSFRLPTSWEWEKACRGVDARSFVWGDRFESTWACVLGHQEGQPTSAPVDAHPIDISLYGVRGQMGNVRDTCGDFYHRSGPQMVNGRHRHSRSETSAFLVVKGGCQIGRLNTCRAASRFAMPPDQSLNLVGFRQSRTFRSGSAIGDRTELLDAQVRRDRHEDQ